jgi:hypothetical protein
METRIRRYSRGSREVVITHPVGGGAFSNEATFDNLSAAYSWLEHNRIDLLDVRGLIAITDPFNPWNREES